MNIAIFVSGHIRTLFYKFDENINIIKEKVGDCNIDVFYSFWDDLTRSESINDPWHVKANNYIQPEVDTEYINQYFKSCGANNVDGEIESMSVMDEVLKNTHFLPENNGKNGLSSQYYKKNRVVEKYYNDDYDFYIQIRPDITINNFISREEIEKIKTTKSLVLNTYYWYNEPYIGRDSNEMIWCAGKKSFKKSNQLYLNESVISKQLSYHYGELVTGIYFNNLVSNGDLDNILTFNFEYKVIR